MKTPAIGQWRQELAAGERTRYTFDALWRAACADANALELISIPELATAYRADARRILVEALKQQRRGVA